MKPLFPFLLAALMAVLASAPVRAARCEPESKPESKPETKPELAPSMEPKRVAILIFPGVQILDFTGPYDVFAGAGFEVILVAKEAGVLETSAGMRVMPHHSFADAPRADILVVPGGGVAQHLGDASYSEWIGSAFQAADDVLSICNGAYFLGQDGHLDGQLATTYHTLIPGLRELAPKADIVEDRRFVDNGKLVVTGGISAGIDGAMHVTEKYLGRGAAMEVALALEYDWRPEHSYARAALADLRIRDALGWNIGPDGTQSQVLVSHGDRSRWSKHWRIESERSAEEVRAAIATRLAQSWAAHGDGRYSFEHNGAEWWGSLRMEPEPDSGQHVVVVEVRRATEDSSASSQAAARP